ncbi:hypothetical protein J6590_013368 [Homalodisca vitripennis]|nr:hypothetical protein J6590_013368 [Homalodisca vitripennis]
MPFSPRDVRHTGIAETPGGFPYSLQTSHSNSGMVAGEAAEGQSLVFLLKVKSSQCLEILINHPIRNISKTYVPNILESL